MNKFNEQYEKWLDECGESEPDPDSAFGDGWNRCKKEVLKILQESVQKYESPQTYYDYIKTIFEKTEKL
jgi:hypothetical protein